MCTTSENYIQHIHTALTIQPFIMALFVHTQLSLKTQKVNSSGSHVAGLDTEEKSCIYGVQSGGIVATRCTSWLDGSGSKPSISPLTWSTNL